MLPHMHPHLHRQQHLPLLPRFLQVTARKQYRTGTSSGRQVCVYPKSYIHTDVAGVFCRTDNNVSARKWNGNLYFDSACREYEGAQNCILLSQQRVKILCGCPLPNRIGNTTEFRVLEWAQAVSRISCPNWFGRFVTWDFCLIFSRLHCVFCVIFYRILVFHTDNLVLLHACFKIFIITQCIPSQDGDGFDSCIF